MLTEEEFHRHDKNYEIGNSIKYTATVLKYRLVDAMPDGSQRPRIRDRRTRECLCQAEGKCHRAYKSYHDITAFAESLVGKES